jgi:hypothetical protein
MQFSSAIPSYHIVEGSDHVYGVGDMLLSYRYQALEEGEVLPAFSLGLVSYFPTAAATTHWLASSATGGTCPSKKYIAFRYARQLRLDLLPTLAPMRPASFRGR